MKCVLYFLLGPVLFLLSFKIQGVRSDRFHILTSPSNPCPTLLTGEPCLTLQQFASSQGHSSSVVLVLESGDHSLTSTLSLSDGYNFTMVPQVANGNVKVVCSTGSSTSSFLLTSISHVHVQGISFVRCTSTFGANGNSALVSNVSFANSGLTIRNMTATIELDHVNFTNCPISTVETSHVIHMRHISFYGGERIATGDATLMSIEDSSFQQGSKTPLRFYSSPSVSVIRCRFIRNNRVSSGFTDGSKGGGVYVYNATVAINDSQFENNRADQGSAIYTYSANLTISGTNFTSNTAMSYGSLSMESKSNLTVINSIFDSNRGSDGAALGVVGCVYIHIAGSSFTGNVATRILSGNDYGAGGVLVTDSSALVTLTNSTFYRNSASYGGVISDQYTLEYVIDGCSFTSNTASRLDGGAIRILGRRDSVLKLIHSSFVGNTAVQDGGALFTTGSMISSWSNFSDNVAGNKGGAVNVWSNVGNATVSVAASYFSNNNGATSGGAVYVQSANTAVNVHDSHFVRNSVTDETGGGGAIQLVGESTNISLVDSTFEQNTATSCAVVSIDNGDHCRVNFAQSTFTSNRATGVSVGGGVLCVGNASISLVGCTFANNSATVHAGVLKVDDCSVKIERSSFINNSANLDGGVAYTYTYPTTYSIRLSTFLNNSAGRDGGALYVGKANSHLIIEKSSMGYNHAAGRGGAVTIAGSHLVIDNQTNMYNNTATAVSACTSDVIVPRELSFIVDGDSVCKQYSGYINRYNISYFIYQDLSATTVAITTASTPPITTESASTTPKQTDGSPHSAHSTMNSYPMITSETISQTSSESSSSDVVSVAIANTSPDGASGSGNNYAILGVAVSVPLVLVISLSSLIVSLLAIFIVIRKSKQRYPPGEDNEFLLTSTEDA